MAVERSSEKWAVGMGCRTAASTTQPLRAD